ncbi:MAG: hypothetical protein IPN32_25945 [Deltaproteobacteria bacterium]|nr:hypothetical protein [Deltaproteobacteria bacterium]
MDNGDRRAETDALMRAGARLRLVHEGGGDDEPATPEELNLRVLLPLMRYLRAEFGQATIDRLARDAGIDEELLRRANAWTSIPASKRCSPVRASCSTAIRRSCAPAPTTW